MCCPYFFFDAWTPITRGAVPQSAAAPMTAALFGPSRACSADVIAFPAKAWPNHCHGTLFFLQRASSSVVIFDDAKGPSARASVSRSGRRR